MLRVWRLCQVAQQATAFSGDGARRYGGRWNSRGLAAVYTAATQSLAALEILVHVDTDLVPNDFMLFAVDIPESVPVTRIMLEDLFILNPLHPDFPQLVIHPPEPFIFDRRLWR